MVFQRIFFCVLLGFSGVCFGLFFCFGVCFGLCLGVFCVVCLWFLMLFCVICSCSMSDSVVWFLVFLVCACAF